MSKFVCQCGHVMNLSIGWSDWELALIPEGWIEKMGLLLADGKVPTIDDFFASIDKEKTTVYRCPNCGRLHLKDKRHDNSFVTYVPEK